MVEPHADITSMESDLLSRLAVNHLFLSQIEPFRATILALRSRNADLARSILQTVISNGGRFDDIVFSSNSNSNCSSALLTYVCTLELIQFNDPVSSIWSFDSNTLRLRAEFLVYVQIIVSRVLECRNEDRNLGEVELGVVNSDSVNTDGVGVSDNDSQEKVEEFGDYDFDECLRVLNKILELGFKRLRSDLIEEESTSGGSLEIDESEMMCLRRVILINDVIFEALCENIGKQVRENVGCGDDDESGLDASPSVQEEDVKVLKLVQRCVQLVHLDVMKECLKEGDLDGAMLHIRFLRFDYGVEEADYRYV